jgi:translation initiation factor 2 beta subunit (eIF-2beta)/eIF-5
MRQVKRTLYDNFTSRGFDVQIEAKLLERHYTHLLFAMPDGKKVAVELGTQRTTANRIDYLAERYKNIGVAVKWIVISNNKTPVKENETFFIKRYLLNEGKRNDVLILNWNGTEITQYVVDPNQYIYRGESLHSKNYPDMYSETSVLSNLVFEDGELSIEGFYSRYNEWLIKKRRAFEKKIAQIEEEARKQKEREQQRQAEFEKAFRERGKQNTTQSNPSVTPHISACCSNKATSMSYEERRESILPLMDQQVEQVIDQTGTRWVRCESCGAVETADKFWMLGGVNRVNLGKCYKCNKR